MTSPEDRQLVAIYLLLNTVVYAIEDLKDGVNFQEVKRRSNRLIEEIVKAHSPAMGRMWKVDQDVVKEILTGYEGIAKQIASMSPDKIPFLALMIDGVEKGEVRFESPDVDKI